MGSRCLVSSSTSPTEQLREAARTTFGWDELRAEQLQAMEQVLAGRDVMVVLPTGAGKSAIYQVPALLIDGPTLIVSPLLALQRDQIRALDQSGRSPGHRNQLDEGHLRAPPGLDGGGSR